MKKYEYKLVRSKTFAEELILLPDLGKEGWELCNVSEPRGSTALYFKRELPPVEEVEEIQELVIGKYINDDGHVSKLLYPNNGEITEKVNELIRAFKVNKLSKKGI